MAHREHSDARDGGAAPIPLTLKGLVACLVLVLYGGIMAAYVLAERQAMLRELAVLDRRQAVEEALKRAGLSVSNAVLSLRGHNMDDHTPDDAAREATPFALEAVEHSLGEWIRAMPGVAEQRRQAQRRLEAVIARPSRAGLLELRESLEGLGRELDREQVRERERHAAMAHEFNARGERIALTALALGLGGLVAFGGVAAVFFARLASDLRALGERARAVVSGYRGAPLEVTRRDEVGALMRDVNQLAADLAARESELAQSRESRAHREKMAALGAAARNLSHEIGNPLAAIAAIAQAGPREGSEAILEQTGRIARITRQMADFSGPRADAPEPVDAATMLATVCDFMQFDPRLRGTRIETRVDGELPPLMVVPDQLSEVLMNLLQLGLEEAPSATGRIVVDAERAGDAVAIRVAGIAGTGDAARRERTRRLVEGMQGTMGEGDDAIVVTIPAASPAA